MSRQQHDPGAGKAAPNGMGETASSSVGQHRSDRSGDRLGNAGGRGCPRVFGYPGGAILPIYDALRKFPIHHMLVRHEQGAAHMADGYARASGRVGVCMATSGPGATNLVTGIATAMLDSMPMVASRGRFRPRCWARMRFRRWISPALRCRLPSTTSSSRAPRTLRRRFGLRSRSRAPAGPGRADRHHQGCAAGHGAIRFRMRAGAARPHPMLRAESSAIREAAALIQSAKRPVILAGHGIAQSGAEQQVMAFAESQQIPVASTLLGLGASLPRIR